jgi:selenocysteine-specific elongation factor
MNLSGLDRGRVERGDALVLPGTWSSTRVVDAEIRVLPEEVTGARHVLEEKGAHLFYCGTAETPVRISLLTGSVGSGQRGLARLWLRNALPLGRGDRFVLRDAGRVLTFGGGKVLDPRPSARKPARPEHVALLNRLVDAGPTEALDALVEAEGSIQRSEALERSGAPEPGPGTVELGDRLASHEHVETLLESLVDELRRWHSDRPLDAGMPRERARATLGLDSVAFDALARRDEVVDEGTTVRLASFGVRLDPSQERERSRIVEKVERGGFSPPLRDDLEAEDSFLRALVETGDLVPVGDFYLTAELAEEAKTRVRKAIAAQGPLTVAQIRDLLETSRKYAVPLCEWLDASGTTRRRGDVRVLAQS